MLTKCVMLTPLAEQKIYLRRFVGGTSHKCDAKVFCLDTPIDTMTDIQIGGSSFMLTRHTRSIAQQKRFEHGFIGKEWPTKCDECEEPFAENNFFQVLTLQMWMRPDLSRTVLRSEGFNDFDLRPGDMWDAVWVEQKNSDGKHLMVVCPNGLHWAIDGPSTNGQGWTRTGTPPLITVQPSIIAGDYHGWLRNGEFTDGV